MNDIKKAIEEASKNYSLQFAEDYREEAKDDFKHGAEWMRNKKARVRTMEKGRGRVARNGSRSDYQAERWQTRDWMA